MTAAPTSAVSLAAAREAAAHRPQDTALYEHVVAQARARFDVYPSHYANAWVRLHYRNAGGRWIGEQASADSGEHAGTDSGEAPVEPLVPTPEGEPTPVADVADATTTFTTAIARLEKLVERLPASPLPPAPAPEQLPRATAFVTTHQAKTLITGPAHTFAGGGWEKSLTPNPHMLWVQGRLVGAETPNRNGALWTAGDLQLGRATVAHGPLNWLHEARHVIGSIADARFIPAAKNGQRAGEHTSEQAAASTDPHILAAANVWKWIYPDEAMVVEQASDLRQLWYSMECYSETVICAEDFGGCGLEVSYADYITSAQNLCGHMAERSSVRRFANPTFLGAAVIVPPTRPGWADADAAVLTQAAAVSEKAYAQAGSPDIPASTFEQMVAQVLRFAEGS